MSRERSSCARWTVVAAALAGCTSPADNERAALERSLMFPYRILDDAFHLAWENYLDGDDPPDQTGCARATFNDDRTLVLLVPRPTTEDEPWERSSRCTYSGDGYGVGLLGRVLRVEGQGDWESTDGDEAEFTVSSADFAYTAWYTGPSIQQWTFPVLGLRASGAAAPLHEFDHVEYRIEASDGEWAVTIDQRDIVAIDAQGREIALGDQW